MPKKKVSKKTERETEAFAVSIGERAARLRKARGINQRDMAARLGISQPHVSHFERGRTRVHAELLAKLAEILEVSADELLGLRPSRPIDTPSPIEQRIWRHVRRIAELPDRDQRAVLRFIDTAALAHSRKSA